MSETIYVTNYQVKKIQSASKKNKEAMLQLTSKNLSPIDGGYSFKITPDLEQRQQLSQLDQGKGARLTIKPKNVQEGGFIPIPLLMAGIGALATVAGTTANTVINHNKAKNEIEVLKKHLEKVESIYNKKGGEPPLPEQLSDIDMLKVKTLQSGGGWSDSRKKVEYKHVESIEKIMERLRYIQAQETAGNKNGFESEKNSIVDYLSDILKKKFETKTLLKVCEILSDPPALGPTPFDHAQKGEGLINTIINKLPIEMHLPGYKYLGPGTYLDTKYPKNIAPINKLDEAAREHDLAYHFNRTVEGRKEADKILENKAWENFKNPSTPLKEKVESWLTTTAMKGKAMLGAGVETAQEGGTLYHYERKLPRQYQNGGSLPSTKMVSRW